MENSMKNVLSRKIWSVQYLKLLQIDKNRCKIWCENIFWAKNKAKNLLKADIITYPHVVNSYYGISAGA